MERMLEVGSLFLLRSVPSFLHTAAGDGFLAVGENLFDFFGVFRGEGAESFYNLLWCENSAVELAQ